MLIRIIEIFGKILKYFNDDVISRCSFIGNSPKLRQLFFRNCFWVSYENDYNCTQKMQTCWKLKKLSRKNQTCKIRASKMIILMILSKSLSKTFTGKLPWWRLLFNIVTGLEIFHHGFCKIFLHQILENFLRDNLKFFSCIKVSGFTSIGCNLTENKSFDKNI